MGTEPEARDYIDQVVDVMAEKFKDAPPPRAPSDKDETVSAAIDVLHSQHKSDGRPHRFGPERTA